MTHLECLKNAQALLEFLDTQEQNHNDTVQIMVLALIALTSPAYVAELFGSRG